MCRLMALIFGLWQKNRLLPLLVPNASSSVSSESFRMMVRKISPAHSHLVRPVTVASSPLPYTLSFVGPIQQYLFLWEFFLFWFFIRIGRECREHAYKEWWIFNFIFDFIFINLCQYLYSVHVNFLLWYFSFNFFSLFSFFFCFLFFYFFGWGEGLINYVFLGKMGSMQI